MGIAVLLAIKNSPLSWLTGWSHERLHVFHRVVGYVALAMTTVHGTTYTAHFLRRGDAARLRVLEEIYGAVAGSALLALVAAGVLLRRRCYELFYVLHVSLFVAAIVFTALHQPETSKTVIVATCAVAVVWVFDRLVRLSRVLFYSYDNTATLYPLPSGGTRIVLRKAPAGTRPGQHCFVWIPKIRSVETHPFTVVGVNPLEFVVSAQNGFTRDIHDYAVANIGVSLKASVEGPYGKPVDPSPYDTVLMIAGGSGASFTFALALEMHRQANLNTSQRVLFVWVVQGLGRQMTPFPPCGNRDLLLQVVFSGTRIIWPPSAACMTSPLPSS